MNPVPLIVSVKPAPPAVAEAGTVEIIVAGAAPIVNVALFDVTPPETTVTVAAPGEATSAVGTRAVNCVKLTKVVASGDPFHSTITPFAKPLPFTVICTVTGSPAGTEAGSRPVMLTPAG